MGASEQYCWSPRQGNVQSDKQIQASASMDCCDIMHIEMMTDRRLIAFDPKSPSKKFCIHVEYMPRQDFSKLIDGRLKLAEQNSNGKLIHWCITLMVMKCLLMVCSLSNNILQHSQNRPTGDVWLRILNIRQSDHKIKLKIRQFQVMGKSTGQINNTGYEWYISS